MSKFSFRITRNTTDQVLDKFGKDSKRVVASVIRRAIGAAHSGMVAGAPRGSGRLRGGIEKIIRPTVGLAGVRDPDLFYGRFFEFGTSRLTARPFVLPPFTSATRNVERELERGLN